MYFKNFMEIPIDIQDRKIYVKNQTWKKREFFVNQSSMKQIIDLKLKGKEIKITGNVLKIKNILLCLRAFPSKE